MCLRLALLALPFALLVGCGGDNGGGGCVTTTDLNPNPSYAGSYAATYTPRQGAIGGSLEFTLNVAADGTVVGSVHNPSTAPDTDADVTGSVLNTSDACGTGRTYVELHYAIAGEETQTLFAQRDVGGTIAATFAVKDVASGTDRTLGSLELQPLALPANRR